MALDEVEREEKLHHLTHRGAGLLVADMEMLQVHHPLVEHQIVEHCLEGVHCILVSEDLDRAELEHY